MKVIEGHLVSETLLEGRMISEWIQDMIESYIGEDCVLTKTAERDFLGSVEVKMVFSQDMVSCTCWLEPIGDQVEKPDAFNLRWSVGDLEGDLPDLDSILVPLHPY